MVAILLETIIIPKSAIYSIVATPTTPITAILALVVVNLINVRSFADRHQSPVSVPAFTPARGVASYLF